MNASNKVVSLFSSIPSMSNRAFEECFEKAKTNQFEKELTRLHRSVTIDFISNEMIDQYPESLKAALINLATELNNLQIEAEEAVYVDDYPF